MITKIIIILLCLIIAGILIYFLSPPSKKYLYDESFHKAAKEIEKKFNEDREEQIKLQSEQIQQEINNIELILEEKRNNYIQLQEQWNKQINDLEIDFKKKKEEISSSLQEHTTIEQRAMTGRLLSKQQEIEKQINEIENKYSSTLIDYENKINDVKLKFEEEEKRLNLKVEEKREEINSLIEQFRKDEEAREKVDFYRISISAAAQNDIVRLKNVAAQLNNPSTLYKLIWKEYYQRGFNDMIGRVLGNNAEKSGIYKITNTKNQMCYIGQAANIKNRWSTHCRRAIKAEEGTSNRLYQIMWEEGLENFTFQVVEFCDKAKLTEREKFYIDFFQAKEYGYNSKN